MGLAERPDIYQYAQWSDDWCSAKRELQVAEWELEKYSAICVREAIEKKETGKSKSVDVAKIIGNDEEQLQKIDELRQDIVDLKDRVTRLQSKMRMWEHAKDLYQTDSYHVMRNQIRTFGDESGA